jgi:hypothetical protein
VFRAMCGASKTGGVSKLTTRRVGHAISNRPKIYRGFKIVERRRQDFRIYKICFQILQILKNLVNPV